VLARPADVRDLGQLISVADEGVALLGRLDIIVASAAISGSAAAHELSEAAWRDVIDVNLTGSWLTCKAAVPHLIAGGRGGAIVLTSLAASHKPRPGQSHYVAAGHAVAGLAKTLAQELAEHGIRVNALSPALDEASMTAGAGSLDLSGALLYLVSDAARYLNGMVLPVDAGAGTAAPAGAVAR
jgi:(+)-trans-carveol dehydrogenase